MYIGTSSLLVAAGHLCAGVCASGTRLLAAKCYANLRQPNRQLSASAELPARPLLRHESTLRLLSRSLAAVRHFLLRG